MEHKAFHKRLKKRIHDYMNSDARTRKKASEYLKMAPDLFYLLLKLGLDKKVPMKYRTAVTAGLAYFILPVDLIPEAITGPAGYIEDVFFAILILHGLIRKFGPDLKIPGNEARHSISKLEEMLGKAEYVVGKSRWNKLNKMYKKSLS